MAIEELDAQLFYHRLYRCSSYTQSLLYFRQLLFGAVNCFGAINYLWFIDHLR